MTHTAPTTLAFVAPPAPTASPTVPAAPTASPTVPAAPTASLTAPSGQPTTYDVVADKAAATVIRGYSTSFGWATRLLREPVRTRIRAVYALVRLADEIVDDPAPVPMATRAAQLAALERDVADALADGQSTNLVVHAFARTARATGITAQLVDPFFASMRADLTPRRHDARSLQEYVHGSAEVVGLMCLRVFCAGRPDATARYDELAPAARRLGAALQKVNFLRDLAADHATLGRAYLPGVDPVWFTDAQRDALLDDIDADLAAAVPAITRLPRDARAGVRAVHGLFAALSARLRRTPAARIATRRVRVPGPAKARILAGALVGGWIR